MVYLIEFEQAENKVFSRFYRNSEIEGIEGFAEIEYSIYMTSLVKYLATM